MGDDLSVVNAARVSFDKYTEQFKAGDAGLITYLADHGHWTPFSQTAITLRMKAPIPIRTQCFKHKVGFTENEVSRRYVDTPPEFFSPVWRGAPTGGAKQGSSGDLGDSPQILFDLVAARVYREANKAYEYMLDRGVCPEQARMLLPQGMQTEWIWTGSLAAYARFCQLRLDPHAQKEIQDLAKMVSDIIEPLYPVSWAALMKSTKV
jgi:thymidylate synthase (FAD)